VHSLKVTGYDRVALLGEREPIAFVTISDPARAIAFYRDLLGLELVADDPFALVFELGPITLRVAKADSVDPAPHTVLGWRVPNIDAELGRLVAAGVEPVRYPHLGQDDRGVWSSPSGASIAWFRDPDGNLLSLTQG
jgi:catechol 2,3-dioxygenase-like lactoylglutathione lyase family enzyme